MSLAALSWAWGVRIQSESSRDMHTQKLVLLHLANCHNDHTGECFPSVERIALDCCLCRSTVFKHLTALEEMGFIERGPRYGEDKHGNRRQISSGYILNLDVHESPLNGLTPVRSTDGSSNGKVLQPEVPRSYKLRKNVVPDSHESGRIRPHPVPLADIWNDKSMEPDTPAETYAQKTSRKRKDQMRCLTPTAVEQKIINRWNSIGVKHREGTVAFGRGVKAIRDAMQGKLFSGTGVFEENNIPYKADRILEAIDGFDLRRNNPSYYPQAKDWIKKVGLADFFFNPRGFHFNGNGREVGRSMFVECLREQPRLVSDQNTELTEYVRERYLDKTGAAMNTVSASCVASKATKYWNEKSLWLKEHRVRSAKMLVADWMGMLTSKHGVDWGPGAILSKGFVSMYENQLEA